MVWYSRSNYRTWAKARLRFYFFLAVAFLSIGAFTGSLIAHLLQPEGVNLSTASIVGWIAFGVSLVGVTASFITVYIMNSIMKNDQAETFKALS